MTRTLPLINGLFRQLSQPITIIPEAPIVLAQPEAFKAGSIAVYTGNCGRKPKTMACGKSIGPKRPPPSKKLNAFEKAKLRCRLWYSKMPQQMQCIKDAKHPRPSPPPTRSSQPKRPQICWGKAALFGCRR